MPEARLKRAASDPENEITGEKVQQISAFLMKTVEQICSAMSASGVALAVRDPEGVRCLASAGDAPAVGSRLQPDSTFTRACLETGEVVLCEDAENDSRIHRSVAKSLNLRSAVAVPIKAHGSVLGVIEVFSSRPSDIYPTDVAALKEFANLFAPIIGPGSVPGVQPVVGGSALLLAQAEAPPPAEEQHEGQRSVSTNRFPAERGFPPDHVMDSPPSPVERGSASSAAVPSIQRLGGSWTAVRAWLAGTMPHIFLRFAAKTTEARTWRGRAASLSFLALLFFSLFLFFFFFGTSRPMAINTAQTQANAQSAAPTPQPISVKTATNANSELLAYKQLAEPAPKKPSLGQVRLATPTVNRSARTPDAGDAGAASLIDGQASPNADALGGGLVAGNTKQPAAPPTPLPVGGDVKPARILNSISPVYPELAKNQHIEGDVRVDALIDANGHVSAMKVVSGPVVLRQAAMAALRQWKYQHATLDGKPVPMHLTVTIQFRMQ